MRNVYKQEGERVSETENKIRMYTPNRVVKERENEVHFMRN